MTRVDKIKEVRHLKCVKGLPIKEIVSRTHLSRNTVRKILRSQQTKFTYRRTHQHYPVTGQIRRRATDKGAFVSMLKRPRRFELIAEASISEEPGAFNSARRELSGGGRATGRSTAIPQKN